MTCKSIPQMSEAATFAVRSYSYTRNMRISTNVMSVERIEGTVQNLEICSIQNALMKFVRPLVEFLKHETVVTRQDLLVTLYDDSLRHVRQWLKRRRQPKPHLTRPWIQIEHGTCRTCLRMATQHGSAPSCPVSRLAFRGLFKLNQMPTSEVQKVQLCAGQWVSSLAGFSTSINHFQVLKATESIARPCHMRL